MFLLLIYSLTGTFVSEQSHFLAYCRCTDAVKLFGFHLSPYSLIGTSNNMQNTCFVSMQIHLRLTVVKHRDNFTFYLRAETQEAEIVKKC
jgi:hypothetical protein